MRDIITWYVPLRALAARRSSSIAFQLASYRSLVSITSIQVVRHFLHRQKLHATVIFFPLICLPELLVDERVESALGLP